MIDAKKILVLAPHTDDAELGCGGTMARFIEEEKEIFVAVFSTAEESLPPGLPGDTLKSEFQKAMPLLGVTVSSLFIYDFPVRRLTYYRQDVLEKMISIRRKISPDLVLLPSQSDVHQDHQVVYAEGLRAFKDLSVFAYELPWNHIMFSAQGFVTLEQTHLDAKWAALQCYRSQIELNRPYMSKEFVYGLARVRGTQVKTEWAEAFEVVRLRW